MNFDRVVNSVAVNGRGEIDSTTVQVQSLKSLQNAVGFNPDAALRQFERFKFILP